MKYLIKKKCKQSGGLGNRDTNNIYILYYLLYIFNEMYSEQTRLVSLFVCMFTPEGSFILFFLLRCSESLSGTKFTLSPFFGGINHPASKRPTILGQSFWRFMYVAGRMKDLSRRRRSRCLLMSSKGRFGSSSSIRSRRKRRESSRSSPSSWSCSRSWSSAWKHSQSSSTIMCSIRRPTGRRSRRTRSRK